VPTLLVTRKMSPALAARVQAAVSGSRAGSSLRKSRVKASLRALTATFVLTAVALVVHFRQQRAAQLTAQRAELSSQLSDHASSLSRADRELPARVAAAVAEHATPAYPGDRIVKELRDEAALNEALAQPTVYLRGPLDALAQPARLADLAAGSAKDAFLLCLLAPPENRTEKALRLKASAASARGSSMQLASHVERVAPLLQALPLFGRDWHERIEAAPTLPALRTLAELIQAAPLTAAVRAAKARQLLLVLDEPGTPTSVVELDGERPHAIRVVLVDLNRGDTRLRFRGNVDPSWLSDATRAQYASGVDGCALALDLRQAATTLPLGP
jgi:hypothetical protein